MRLCYTVFLAALVVTLALSASADCPTPVSSLSYGVGNRLPHDVVVRYGLAYAADDLGLTVYRLDGPDAIEVVGELELEGGASELTLAGTLACLSRYGGDTVLVDVSVPNQPRVLSVISPSEDVVVSRGHALLVQSHDVTVVDVRTPEAPVELGTTAWASPRVRRARAAVHGSMLLIATGTQELVSADLSKLDEPRVTSILHSPGTAVDVALHENLGAVAVRETGLLVLDLSGGLPEIVGTVPLVGIEHVVLARHTAIATTAAGEVVTVDLSQPRQPEILGTLDGLGKLTTIAWRPGEVVVADSSSGLRRVELGDLRTLTLRPERARSHGVGRDIVVTDSTAIVANGPAGLLIADVRFPQSPREVARLELDGGANALSLDTDRALLMAAGDMGLHVVDVSRPRRPDPLGFLEAPSALVDVEHSDTTAHALQPDGTVLRIDVADPYRPELVAQVSVDTSSEYTAHTLAVVGDHALVAGESLWQLDLTGESASHEMTDLGTLRTAIITRGATAVMAAPYGLLWGIDLSTIPAELALWGQGQLSVTSDLDWTSEAGLIATRLVGLPYVELLDTREMEPAQPGPWGSCFPPDPPQLTFLGGALVDGRGYGAFAFDRATDHGWVTTETALTGLDLRCSACSQVTVAASPGLIRTGGERADLVVSVTDLAGDPFPGAPLTATTTRGTLSSWSETEIGTYTADLVSGPLSGDATVQVALDGMQCAAATTITIECATPLPTPPAQVTATPAPGPALEVSWQPTDGAQTYTVYRGAVPIATVDASSTSFLMHGLSEGTTYTVAVSATDSCGRETNLSAAVEVTLPGVGVTTIDMLASTQFGDYTRSTNFAIHRSTGFSADVAGVAIWDLGDPTAAEIAGRWSWRKGVRYVQPATSEHLVVISDRGDIGILDTREPTQPKLVSAVRDVEDAHAVVVSSDGRWAYVAAGWSLVIVDLADPSRPEVVATTGSWEYHDMALAGNRLVGVLADGSVTLIDISDPTDPEDMHIAASDQLSGARCVAANGSRAVIGLTHGVAVMDTADGTLLGRIDDPALQLERLATIDGGHVAGVDGSQVWTIEVSDPAHPTATLRAVTPASHLATGDGFLWLTSPMGAHRIVDTSSWTVISDLSDRLGDARTVVAAADGAIAVANGEGGVVLLDNSDPSLPPTITARVRTSDAAHDLDVHHDGAVLVACGSAGLVVLSANGEMLASLPLRAHGTSSADTVREIEVEGNLAVLEGDMSLYAVDVTDPRSPELLSTVPPAGAGGATVASGAETLALIGHTAYRGALAVDLTDPRAPIVLQPPTATLECLGADIDRSTTLTFAATNAPLTVCKQQADGWLTPITDEVSGLTVQEPGLEVSLSGSTVLLLTSRFLYLIDSADPAGPVRRFTHVPRSQPPRSFSFNGRIGYLVSPMELAVVALTGPR